MMFQGYYVARDGEADVEATHVPGSGQMTVRRAVIAPGERGHALIAELSVPAGGRPMTLREFVAYVERSDVREIAERLGRRERSGGLDRIPVEGRWRGFREAGDPPDVSTRHVFEPAEGRNMVALDPESHRRSHAGEDPHAA